MIKGAPINDIYLKVKGDSIDRDDSSSCKVLQCPSEKGLREKEPGDPKYGGDAPINPLSNELYPGD